MGTSRKFLFVNTASHHCRYQSTQTSVHLGTTREPCLSLQDIFNSMFLLLTDHALGLGILVSSRAPSLSESTSGIPWRSCHHHFQETPGKQQPVPIALQTYRPFPCPLSENLFSHLAAPLLSSLPLGCQTSMVSTSYRSYETHCH
jgi:hypothetical protein